MLGIKIKTFNLEDLIDRTLKIMRFNDNRVALIMAIDTNSGEVFILKEITLPTVMEAA